MRKKRVLEILVVMWISLSFLWVIQINAPAKESGEGAITVTYDIVRYAIHGPIRINGDSDFTSQNGVVGGSGTQSDPYIISGWRIDAHGSGNAIYIGNTTKYFVVENCKLYNASYHSLPYYIGAGITLYNVKNGTIRENVIFDNDYNLYLRSSNGNTITNNEIYNSAQWYGVFVEYSMSILIETILPKILYIIMGTAFIYEHQIRII